MVKTKEKQMNEELFCAQCICQYMILRKFTEPLSRDPQILFQAQEERSRRLHFMSFKVYFKISIQTLKN